MYDALGTKEPQNHPQDTRSLQTANFELPVTSLHPFGASRWKEACVVLIRSFQATRGL